MACERLGGMSSPWDSYELAMNQTDPVLVIRQLIGGYA